MRSCFSCFVFYGNMQSIMGQTPNCLVELAEFIETHWMKGDAL